MSEETITGSLAVDAPVPLPTYKECQLHRFTVGAAELKRRAAALEVPLASRFPKEHNIPHLQELLAAVQRETQEISKQQPHQLHPSEQAPLLDSLLKLKTQLQETLAVSIRHFPQKPQSTPPSPSASPMLLSPQKLHNPLKAFTSFPHQQFSKGSPGNK